MTVSHQLDWRAQCVAVGEEEAGLHRSSLDDPHFESLLLRLNAATDVPGFWSTVQSILNEVVPSEAKLGDFAAREASLLNRLHPYLETTLQRLSMMDEPAVNGRARHGIMGAAPISFLHEPFSRLTPAERQLIELVGEGLSNKEVAARLHKSVRTVKTQLTSVFKKFGVRSRSRLLALMR